MSRLEAFQNAWTPHALVAHLYCGRGDVAHDAGVKRESPPLVLASEVDI